MSNSKFLGPRQPNTGTSVGGINDLSEHQQLKGANLWPTVPDAPTGVSAVLNGSSALDVSFTPPSYVGSAAITSYRVTASTGQTATGSGSPITVTGLASGNTVTCTVAAQNAVGFSAESSPSSGVLIPSIQTYTTPGSYTFTVPAGVTAVSVAAIGGGGGGFGSNVTPGSGAGGGAFAYANNVSVSPGNTLNVLVGAGGTASNYPTDGGESRIENNTTGSVMVRVNGGSAAAGSTGGNGGTVITGSGGSGGNGGPRGGNYGSGVQGGGGGGGAGGKTSAGGTGADAGQGNPSYSHGTHGSASGGSGGFGGGTNGYMGGGVAFDTASITATSMYSQPNMPSVAQTFHAGSSDHYGGGGGGAYGTNGVPKAGQGGACQIKWGGATY